MSNLRQLWTTTVPGFRVNVYLCDPSSNSLFVGDGWGVPYAALRLHRLELSSGRHIAEVRTRHQGVSALTIHEGLLYAATDSRLLEMRPTDLGVARDWDSRLVRYTQQMVAMDRSLVMANWLVPSIGVFNLASGRTKRLRVGLQPLIFTHGGAIKVIAGFDGGMWDLDLDSVRLEGKQVTPPLSSIGVGDHIWGTLAGEKEGGQGDPPVWSKPGTRTIIRLTGPAWTGEASGIVRKIACDDRRGVLWCIVGGLAHWRLDAVSQTTGKLIASFPAAESAESGFHHVDPAAGIAIQAPYHHVTKGHVVLRSTSTVTCYALPDPEP